ncbi:hypothetical protein BDA99DRAFT_502627 [Phascolomyces articulosus]|uniref:Xylanolytic transcriptional activator regulatory domain-containing protein n=1 Tax=Phascolomyces articulosus TaxID=60185 RepID=A0AAD5KHE9_9FUNG|nr:hypothetical protein BDA99DRAFT_502627 [Phascolomyces articulosus]
MPSTKHNGSIPIDHFLKEALQILRHATLAVATPTTNTSQQDNDNDHQSQSNDNNDDQQVTNQTKQDPTVIWKLNLSPTTMTLDTNIQTIAGLEKVIEQLSVNIQPRPLPPSLPPLPVFHSSRYKSNDNDEYHQMPEYLHAIATALVLSSVFPSPKADIFRQFNSMQLMRQCVQAFVMCDGAIFFHIPRLLAETDLVLTHPAASKDHPVETLLVLSICSLMIRHVMMHKQGPPQIAAGLMHAYYAHARLLLQDLFDDTHHLSVVQALFLLSVYPQGHVDLFSPARTRSSLFSLTLRMALAMDFHRIDIDDRGAIEEVDNDNNNGDSKHHNQMQQQSEEEKEKLRRFSWMLLCADYFTEWNASGTTGRIDVADWHVNFPQPLPSEEQQQQQQQQQQQPPGSAPPVSIAKRVEYLALYSRVVIIRKMHLFRSAYSIVHRSPKGRESSMDEMLFETYMNTPPSFQLELTQPDKLNKKTWTRSDLEPLLLHTLYYDTLISTHVPFLPKRYLQTLERERSIRVSHVKDIYERIKNPPPSSSSPQQQQAIAVSLLRLLPDYASFTKNNWARESPSPSSLPTNSRSSGRGNGMDESSSLEVELYTVVGCLDAACHFTLVLEFLLVVDPIGCYHSPIYGALTTSHIYHMLELNSQDPDVVHLCRINLIRTLRIIQQARMVHADTLVLYLQRILPQWLSISTDEPTVRLQQQASDILYALRERAKKSKPGRNHTTTSHKITSSDDGLQQVVKTETTSS